MSHPLPEPTAEDCRPAEIQPGEKPTYEAVSTFRYLLRRFVRASEENARAAGLPPQQYLALLTIAGRIGRDSASVGDVAECLQVTHHAAVGLIQRCVRAGLVCRDTEESDRRTARLTLTQRGLALLREIVHQNQRELRALVDLDAEHLRALERAETDDERAAGDAALMTRVLRAAESTTAILLVLLAGHHQWALVGQV